MLQGVHKKMCRSFFLISQLPNIVQKSFSTSDEAMDPTFKMNYVQVF